MDKKCEGEYAVVPEPDQKFLCFPFELLQNKLVMTSYLRDGHGKTVSDIADACVKMSADCVILLKQMRAQLHLYIFSLDIFVKSESWSGCW